MPKPLKQAVLVMLLVLVSSCNSIGQEQAGGPSPQVLDESELIVLAKRPGRMLIERAQELSYDLRRVDDLPELDDVLVTLGIPPGKDIPQAIAEIEAAVPGVTAGAHHLYTVQSDPTASPSGAAMISWPRGGCKARMRIGLIDTGLPADDPLVQAGRVVQEQFVAPGRAPRSDHGALMARLLVGEGRMTGAQVFSANVVDPRLARGETAGVSAILNAVNWLRAQDVKVANISLAGPRNKLLNRGLGRAAEAGMIIVAAAGNQGPAAAPQYPAAFPFVIAATAVGQDGKVFSNAVQGAHIDVAAPGVDIVVSGSNGLRILSGTSAAAPFVTSSIAVDPRLAGASVTRARGVLARGARDLGAPGPDPVFGAGLVQAPGACAPGLF
ncbi:MAG: S8 family serine peptidase [Pseudomonadota bacterium]